MLEFFFEKRKHFKKINNYLDQKLISKNMNFVQLSEKKSVAIL